MPLTGKAGPGISGACRPSRACISLACPGRRGADPRSSGASGTTPSTSRTTSPSSAATWPTHRPPNARPRLFDASSESPMAHTRIRKFNTRDTYPEQKLDDDLCQAVAGNTTGFRRGQIGEDLDTRESVGIGDVSAQAEKAIANIKMLLEEAGSELSHICKITIYLVDVRYREAVYKVVGRWLKGVFPASTGVVVSALARPEWLVEIDATAVIPDKR